MLCTQDVVLGICEVCVRDVVLRKCAKMEKKEAEDVAYTTFSKTQTPQLQPSFSPFSHSPALQYSAHTLLIYPTSHPAYPTYSNLPTSHKNTLSSTSHWPASGCANYSRTNSRSSNQKFGLSRTYSCISNHYFALSVPFFD